MKKQLKDITNIKFGYYAKPKEKGFVKYLQAKNFDDYGILNQEIDSFITIDKKNEGHLLEDGDILFVGKGFRNFAWTYNKSFGPAIASSIFFVIKPNNKNINPDFIKTLFNSQKYQLLFQSMSAGSSIPSIRKAELESIFIDIPDLETQNKIACLNELHIKEIELSNKIIEQKNTLYQNVINQIIK